MESFHGMWRDELLNGDVFDTWQEAHVLAERWRLHYHAHRPHRARGYRPPAPDTCTVAPISCLSV